MLSFLSSEKLTPADRLSGIPGREPQRLRFPTVARLSTKKCAILNRLGCLMAVTIRLFAFRELMKVLTATRRLITTGTMRVLQQRRNLSLARGKYRIGVRISISFVLYGAMDACGARQSPILVYGLR